VVEIGAGQGAAAASVARAAGLTAVAVHPDLAGRDRMVVAQRPLGSVC
jgi:release factor glutamine methyltransferase